MYRAGWMTSRDRHGGDGRDNELHLTQTSLRRAQVTT